MRVITATTLLINSGEQMTLTEFVDLVDCGDRASLVKVYAESNTVRITITHKED